MVSKVLPVATCAYRGSRNSLRSEKESGRSCHNAFTSRNAIQAGTIGRPLGGGQTPLGAGWRLTRLLAPDPPAGGMPRVPQTPLLRVRIRRVADLQFSVPQTSGCR
jgi:hypothetical protein